MNTETISTDLTSKNQMSCKVIQWETNYNNKMHCFSFPHVDLAPKSLPIRSKLESTIIEIRTKDNSHNPIKRVVYDLLIIKVKELNDMMAMMSHDMTASDLIDHLFEIHGNNFSLDASLCIYFYQSVR